MAFLLTLTAAAGIAGAAEARRGLSTVAAPEILYGDVDGAYGDVLGAYGDVLGVYGDGDVLGVYGYPGRAGSLKHGEHTGSKGSMFYGGPGSPGGMHGEAPNEDDEVPVPWTGYAHSDGPSSKDQDLIEDSMKPSSPLASSNGKPTSGSTTSSSGSSAGSSGSEGPGGSSGSGVSGPTTTSTGIPGSKELGDTDSPALVSLPDATSDPVVATGVKMPSPGSGSGDLDALPDASASPVPNAQTSTPAATDRGTASADESGVAQLAGVSAAVAAVVLSAAVAMVF